MSERHYTNAELTDMIDQIHEMHDKLVRQEKDRHQTRLGDIAIIVRKQIARCVRLQEQNEGSDNS